MKRFVVAWLICSFFAMGILMADERAQSLDFERWHGPDEVINCRKDQSHAAGLALVGGPMSLIVSIFATGFAQNGLQWTCSPDELRKLNKKGD